MKGNAVRVNDEPVTDDRMTVSDAQLAEGVVKLSVGRKKHVLVRPV